MYISKNLKKIFKQISLKIIMVVLLVPIFFFGTNKPTHAFVDAIGGVSGIISASLDFVSTGWETAVGAFKVAEYSDFIQKAFEFIKTKVLVITKQIAVREIIATILEWSATGFEGKPQFGQNIRAAVQNYSEVEFANFLTEQKLDFLCGNFLEVEVKNFVIDYKNLRDKPRTTDAKCTFDKLNKRVKNIEDGNFSWKSFVGITRGKTNNLFELVPNITEVFGEKKEIRQYNLQKDKDLGGGFSSNYKCDDVAWKKHFESKLTDPVWESYLDGSKKYPNFKKNDGSKEAALFCDVTTQGVTLKTNLDKALGVDVNSLIAADQWWELVAAVAAKSLTNGLVAKGAAGVNRVINKITDEEVAATYATLGADTKELVDGEDNNKSDLEKFEVANKIVLSSKKTLDNAYLVWEKAKGCLDKIKTNPEKYYGGSVAGLSSLVNITDVDFHALINAGAQPAFITFTADALEKFLTKINSLKGVFLRKQGALNLKIKELEGDEIKLKKIIGEIEDIKNDEKLSRTEKTKKILAIKTASTSSSVPILDILRVEYTKIDKGIDEIINGKILSGHTPTSDGVIRKSPEVGAILRYCVGFKEINGSFVVKYNSYPRYRSRPILFKLSVDKVSDLISSNKQDVPIINVYESGDDISAINSGSYGYEIPDGTKYVLGGDAKANSAAEAARAAAAKAAARAAAARAAAARATREELKKLRRLERIARAVEKDAEYEKGQGDNATERRAKLILELEKEIVAKSARLEELVEELGVCLVEDGKWINNGEYVESISYINDFSCNVASGQSIKCENGKFKHSALVEVYPAKIWSESLSCGK